MRRTGLKSEIPVRLTQALSCRQFCFYFCSKETPDVCCAWIRLVEPGLVVKEVMSVTSHTSAEDMAPFPHNVRFSVYHICPTPLAFPRTLNTHWLATISMPTISKMCPISQVAPVIYAITGNQLEGWSSPAGKPFPVCSSTS